MNKRQRIVIFVGTVVVAIGLSFLKRINLEGYTITQERIVLWLLIAVVLTTGFVILLGGKRH